MRVTTEETVIKSTIAVMRMFCSDQIVAFLWHPPTPQNKDVKIIADLFGSHNCVI